MPERATYSAKLRVGCALTLSALAVGACSTYDPALLVGYNAAIAADAGADSAGSDAGRAGATAGAGASSDAGSTQAAGSAGLGLGEAGMGSGAEAGTTTDAGVAGHSGLGGSSSTGGTVGAGGSAAAGATAAGATAGGASSASLYELIDDFEDLDSFILSSHKRNGPWYVFNDMTKTGVAGPLTIALLGAANARPGSSAGLHLTASGFTDWGAGVGADFVNQAAKKVPYDVSAYSGIRFYAKVASGSQATMKVLIPTVYSDADGGKCSDSVTGKHCSDHLFHAVSGLQTTWQVYQCNFDELVQQGFGLVQPTLDPTGVYSMQFTLVTKALPADIWIDDVSFVKK